MGEEEGIAMSRFFSFLVVTIFTVPLLLAFGGGPALAQMPSAEPTTATTYTDSVQGIEFWEGMIVGNTRLGASFGGDASGDLPGVMVASIDYTPPSPGPSVSNEIVGGRWALFSSQGKVFGTFDGGTVQWNADGTLAEVEANMSVLGGAVDGRSVAGGVGTFGGVLDHTPLTEGLPPTVGGTLQLAL